MMADHVADIRAARILVVDDERNNRNLLQLLLEPEGFAIVTAASGEEALAMVAAAPPDLILLDIAMPGMNGFEVASRIKGSAATKNIPVIMVTAMDDRNARILGLNAGAEDFLTKPVDRVELSVRVRNLLRLKAYGDYHDKYSHMLEGEVTRRMADLVESERLYRSTFDGAPVGIVHVGLDGQWLRVNQRICDLLEYPRDELRGIALEAIMDASEVAADAKFFGELAQGTLDRPVSGERQYRRRGGSVMWARVNVSVHRDAKHAPQHFILVIEDITDRRALEAQLRQTNKMDGIGQLAGGIAHDFNNLLSVILSYSEMLAQDLKEGDPMREDLQQINEAGVRAGALTRQLLAFSRKQVLQPKVVNLTEVVDGMKSMLGRLIGEDIELSAASAPVRAKIMVDPGQLEQVILNLAVNARDAMPKGGRLTIEVTESELDDAEASAIGCVMPGPHVMLTVRDTGSGIDKETQARMFEPFFTTKGEGKGTGLGLATVFGIVRQSDGCIRVESELGVGTIFKLYFPIVDGARLTPISTQVADVRTLRGSETILLVEDEERVRALACTILRKYGYDVLDAQSGGDALLLCEQHEAPIHLLLTDVVMPRMNGRVLADRLRVIRPQMKVLYMSGYMDDAVVRNGLQTDTIAFIQKPLTPEALARKVRETLNLSSARDFAGAL